MAETIIGHKRGYNISAPGANTNIFSTGITPVYPVGALRVTVCLATASVFNLRVINTPAGGSTAFTIGLNASSALNAGDLYTFTFGCNNDLTYNFQVETDGIINVLQVEEIPVGAL